ncbi:MAG: ferredoxin--NADP reductase [Bdellovibrionales bacterium]|nr:ferredoxin--NADP reductase [Bdellovibrionales bacterium]
MLNATLVRRINITDQLAIFHIRPDAGVPDFLPGQYLAIGLFAESPRIAGSSPDPEEAKPDKLIKRAYSIGSAPSEKDHIELYIAFVNDGLLTPRLACLEEGDRLFAAPKIVGTFTLKDVPADHNLVLVSTGTGIAPFLSMVRNNPTWTKGRTIKILHGVRYAKDFAYQEELIKLANENNNFFYYATVSREDPAWNGSKGYVQKFFESDEVLLDVDKDHVFVCGNPAMIEDLETFLTTKNYSVHSRKNPEGKLHVEKYW